MMFCLPKQINRNYRLEASSGKFQGTTNHKILTFLGKQPKGRQVLKPHHYSMVLEAHTMFNVYKRTHALGHDTCEYMWSLVMTI